MATEAQAAGESDTKKKALLFVKSPSIQNFSSMQD